MDQRIIIKTADAMTIWRVWEEVNRLLDGHIEESNKSSGRIRVRPSFRGAQSAMQYRLVDKATGLFVVLNTDGRIRYTSQWGEARVFLESAARKLAEEHDNLALVESPRKLATGGLVRGATIEGMQEYMRRLADQGKVEAGKPQPMKIKVLGHATTVDELASMLEELKKLENFLRIVESQEDDIGELTSCDGRYSFEPSKVLRASLVRTLRQRAEVIRKTLRSVSWIDA